MVSDIRRWTLDTQLTFHRLAPYLYRTVHLHGEDTAVAFLASLQPSSSYAKNVTTLYIGKSVTITAIVQVLTLCVNLNELTLQATSGLRCISDESKGLLMEPLYNLQCLKKLHVGLSAIPTPYIAHLPDFQLFSRITHLHLAGGVGTGTAISEGMSMLQNLTHLSLQWSVARYCNPTLKEFLEHPSTVVLVLWTAGLVAEERIKSELGWRGLAQARVVLLATQQIPVFMLDGLGGFWAHAERIAQWRLVNKGAIHPPCSLSPILIKFYSRGFEMSCAPQADTTRVVQLVPR